ncbi:MAG: hypothetical protein Q9168_003745 [Polycauliona sp. 1 TL-2023]
MAKRVKITEDGFKIGIGFMLAVAVSLAIGRGVVRARLNRKIYVDDGFFILAVATLIAGTIMTYLDIPYIYLQENVQAGTQAPPANLEQQLIHSVKIQNAAAVLLSATVFSVKLTFLVFFRALIRRLRKLEIWWWFVLVVAVITSIILICGNFISCPYYDERILVKCVSPSALGRQNATLRAVSILDILSDLFIISIPVALLWRARIDLRRKFALGTMLCLSVFTIITVIVKISGGNTNNGQIDSSWVIFWLHMEAAVAVMVASIIAYRALFVVERLRTQESPRYISRVRARLVGRSKASQETGTATTYDPGTPFRNSNGDVPRPDAVHQQHLPSRKGGTVPWEAGNSQGYPLTNISAPGDAGNPDANSGPHLQEYHSSSAKAFPDASHQQIEDVRASSSEHLAMAGRHGKQEPSQGNSPSLEHSRDLNQVTRVCKGKREY